MKKITNECVECPQGCIHCGRKHVERFYCDCCGEEAEQLYNYQGQELCRECLEDQMDEVEALEG